MEHSFEDAIINAIANQFFVPTIAYMDANNNPVWASPPAWNIAQQIYKANEKAIFDAVAERFDIYILAEELSKKVLAAMEEKPTTYGWNSHYAQDFQRDLRAKVIDKLAEAKAAELMRAEDMNKQASSEE